MPEFLQLPREDQREALLVAAERSGRPLHLLEKDVWVVWALNHLFAGPHAQQLVFTLSPFFGRMSPPAVASPTPKSRTMSPRSPSEGGWSRANTAMAPPPLRERTSASMVTTLYEQAQCLCGNVLFGSALVFVVENTVQVRREFDIPFDQD